MEDYRKADPNYTGFVPKTAAEAIDLFTRYRKLGVPPSQWPETFCLVAQALPEIELDDFRDWLINPQGVQTAGPLYEPCPETEAERVQLAAEADARDDEKLPEKLLLPATLRVANPEPVGKGLEKPLEVGPDPT